MNTNLAHFDRDGALIVDTVAMMQTEGFQKQMEALDRCFKAREILEEIRKTRGNSVGRECPS